MSIRQLTASFCQAVSSTSSMEEVADSLRKLEKHSLDFAPWAAHEYRPVVRFSISYSNTAIFLQFEVKENFIKAGCGTINDPVYNDSCLEFFISFDEGNTYYNIEFNCIGAVLAEFGQSREDREALPPTELEKIKSEVYISRNGKEVRWEITLIIPITVFVHHPLIDLKGASLKANFYKCGDALPEPHFLCWSNVESSQPNFHLPQFFGVLKFQ